MDLKDLSLVAADGTNFSPDFFGVTFLVSDLGFLTLEADPGENNKISFF